MPWIVGALILLGIIVAGIIAAIWFLIDEDEEGLDIGVTASDILDDPQEYYGVDVTVSGEVDDVIADRAFAIGGGDFLAGDQLLIVTANPIDTIAAGEEALEEADIIQVSGTVRQLTEAELGTDYDFLFDDDAFNDFEDGPVIIATDVALSPRINSDVATTAIGIDDIQDNLDQFAGQQVTVDGETELIIGGVSFVMHEEQVLDEADVVDTDLGLLVVAEEGVMPENLVDDAFVSAQGTVYELDEDASPELAQSFPFLFEDDIYDAFDGGAVLVASSISTGPEAITPDLNEVAVNAAAYLGETVTVGGEVEETINPQAFIITSDDDADLEASVLVLLPDGADAQVVDDAFAQVTGEVAIFAVAELEDDDDFLGIDFDDDVFDDWESQPVILAESITVER